MEKRFDWLMFETNEKKRRYLGWMVNDRGDLFGVTLKCCHDLLLVLVKHHHVLISST